MATLREIRKRIRSVRNIAQVTRAMQTVAATKMRRAQAAALAARPYADRSWEMLASLCARLSPAQQRSQPLLQVRPVRTVEMVLFTSNRGLCGGYNHNIIAEALRFVNRQDAPVRMVTVGRKGREYCARRGLEIVADFEAPDHPTTLDVRAIVEVLADDLVAGRADQVWLAYTEFISTLTQRPQVRQLLPIQGGTCEPGNGVPYLLEPAVDAIIGPLLRRVTEIQVYRALLEALASEHSARMVAMRGATDNAHHLMGDLTLSYNKARQEAITKELIDIVGGVAALS